MFDFLWNWLDPKILKMENWVNLKVIEPDKIDIDLDKVKKNEVRENNMFRKPIPGTNGKVYGPFIIQLTGARLLGFLVGPYVAVVLFWVDNNTRLWWRHRVGGSTEDFMEEAFIDMEDFYRYVSAAGGDKYWDCVLRTEATLTALKEGVGPELTIPDIRTFLADRRAPDAANAQIAE